MAVDFDFEVILQAMKKAAGALRDAEVPFALGGGLAVWARGGAKTEHDVDFFVKQEDAERAQQALVDAGLKAESPPEGWLLKAWDGNVLIDLIFEPRGGPVGDDWFERAEELDVYAVTMLVASLDDVLVTKLLALTEQNLDYSSVLEVARAVREQLDWDEVRRRCEGSRTRRRSSYSSRSSVSHLPALHPARRSVDSRASGERTALAQKSPR